MARIGLVFGGRTTEHRVSVKSARTVAQALAAAGHEVVPLGVAEDGCWVGGELSAAALAGERDHIAALGVPIRSTIEVLLRAPIDVIFPIIHGSWGEDGSLQGLCEMLDLPYVGTGVMTSAVAMDKVAAKRLLAAAGLPVTPYRALRRPDFEAEPERCLEGCIELPLPLFVKPSLGGSSVGVRKVSRRDELEGAIRFAFGFADEVLVEQGIIGRELECAVLGYRRIEASVIGEIIPGRDFYDYEDKYITDGARLLAPAELPEATSDRLRALAIEAFEVLGGWGMSRVDFFLTAGDEAGGAGGGVYINELNTLPGFTSISMYPRLWELSGLPRPALVDRLVSIAVERHRHQAHLDAAIKDFLATLG